MELMAQVLCQLPQSSHPNLLAGTRNHEDAGILRISEDLAIVVTTDFFPPLVDDPATFGRIAAANSLSDVYAVGGEPLCALNLVAFPDNQLPADLLVEILAGGAEKVAEAGAVIAGGHSIRDAEIKYGLAVTGRIHPDRIVFNSRACVGDVLILTKPIGSGVLTTAAKKEWIGEADLAEAIAVMATLNRRASESMRAVGVHAATDITGFGLLGHAFEMASGAGVRFEIDARAVPLITGAYDLAAKGCVTRAHQSTLAHIGSALQAGAMDETLIKTLADAQTSGGLLISVAPERASDLLTRLHEIREPFAPAAVIGRVAASDVPTLVLV